MKNILSKQQIEEIQQFCEDYNINDYNMNPDGSIDVNHSLDLDDLPDHITQLPITFNTVHGNVYVVNSCITTLVNFPRVVMGNVEVTNNLLTSLEGCPQLINGYFDCSNNKLNTLEFGPTHLQGSYDCSNNKLKSLQFSPKHINGSFSCSNTTITSLEFGPETVVDAFLCDDNHLTSLEFAPTKVREEFICTGNDLTTIADAPSNVGGFSCYGNKKLPKYLLDTFARLTYEIPIFLKYQNHYDVWTNGFSEENMNALIEEIEDGLR